MYHVNILVVGDMALLKFLVSEIWRARYSHISDKQKHVYCISPTEIERTRHISDRKRTDPAYLRQKKNGPGISPTQKIHYPAYLRHSGKCRRYAGTRCFVSEMWRPRCRRYDGTRIFVNLSEIWLRPLVTPLWLGFVDIYFRSRSTLLCSSFSVP